MNRKSDPEDKDFSQDRRVCSSHEAIDEKLTSLITTVQGDDSVESKSNSLVGIASKTNTAIRVNGWWLRGIAGLVCALMVPFSLWVIKCERTMKQVEIDTQKWSKIEPEHQKILQDIEVLKTHHDGSLKGSVQYERNRV